MKIRRRSLKWSVTIKVFCIIMKVFLQVPLGIVLHNENKGEEMVKIVSHMQQYVPALNCSDVTYIPSSMQTVATPEVVFHKKLFGGDQFTAARVRGAQTAKSNGKTALNRLDGVIPVVEDWHTEVLLYEV